MGQSGDLDARLNTMFQKNTDENYICLMCSYSNGVKQNMKKHVEIHLPSTGNPCGFCGKIFKTSNSLNTHISTRHRKLKY